MWYCHSAGTDGTGNSIIPQLPGLVGAGFDIRYAAIQAFLHEQAGRQCMASTLVILTSMTPLYHIFNV